jgi:hypothetical protein
MIGSFLIIKGFSRFFSSLESSFCEEPPGQHNPKNIRKHPILLFVDFRCEEFLFDVLKWPLDGNPAAFSDDTRAVNAVLGGTMVGWGVLMYLLATPQRIHALPELPRLLLIGVVAWFVVDCIGSILAGLPGNIVLNIGFLGLFVPPLLALWRHQ